MNLEITRKIDDLGRINLPLELRKALDWGIGDEIILKCVDDVVTLEFLQKSESPLCSICNKPQRKLRINGKDYCDSCAEMAG